MTTYLKEQTLSASTQTRKSRIRFENEIPIRQSESSESAQFPPAVVALEIARGHV